MDEGKRALLKAEDLEARLNTLQKKSAVRAALSAAAAPGHHFRLGGYPLQSVYAAGSVSVTVKASVTCISKTSDALTLLIGGVIAAAEPVSGDAGETIEVLLLAGVYIGGAATLTLFCAETVVLDRVTLLIDGEGALLTGERELFAADEREGRCLLITSASDRIYGHGFPSDAAALDTPFVIGSGRTGDVTATENGFAVVHADNLNNVYLSLLTADYTLRLTKFLTDGATAAVTAGEDGGLLVAVPCGAGVRLLQTDADGVIGRENVIGFTREVKTVAFVKRAEQPAMVLYDGERAFLKLPVLDHAGTDRAAVTLEMTVTEA